MKEFVEKLIERLEKKSFIMRGNGDKFYSFISLDIATLINESQIIWNKCVEENKNIVDWCEEVTGFDIRNSVS